MGRALARIAVSPLLVLRLSFFDIGVGVVK
jgi:hypothetical protein